MHRTSPAKTGIRRKPSAAADGFKTFASTGRSLCIGTLALQQATRPLVEPDKSHQAPKSLNSLPSLPKHPTLPPASPTSRLRRNNTIVQNTPKDLDILTIPTAKAAMSTHSQQSASMSHTNSQASCHDPLDSLVDFSEYDKLSYQSPSISPSANKTQFTSRAVSNTPATLPSSSQPDLSGPSHNYGMYKQQTGIPQGAVASTLAVNQMNQYNGYADGYLSGFGTGEKFVDFGSAPNQTGFDMDMEFDSPKQEPAFFYPEASPEFINPQSTISTPAVLPTQTSNVGRLWPGMHQQQAALAKAQAQQKQQQQIIQQQRQNAMVGQPKQAQRARGSTVTDPIVEEKISQLLNSMRHSSVGSDETSNGNNMSHVQRARKDEEDMDEDERLLASEEGKKLSSKERRQLRNKVSARAFRSRRKGKNIPLEINQQMLTYYRIHWPTRRRDRCQGQREHRSSCSEQSFDGGEYPSFGPHPHASVFPIILRFSRYSCIKPSRRTNRTSCSATSTGRATTTTSTYTQRYQPVCSSTTANAATTYRNDHDSRTDHGLLHA